MKNWNNILFLSKKVFYWYSVEVLVIRCKTIINIAFKIMDVIDFKTFILVYFICFVAQWLVEDYIPRTNSITQSHASFFTRVRAALVSLIKTN